MVDNAPWSTIPLSRATPTPLSVDHNQIKFRIRLIAPSPFPLSPPPFYLFIFYTFYLTVTTADTGQNIDDTCSQITDTPLL